MYALERGTQHKFSRDALDVVQQICGTACVGRWSKDDVAVFSAEQASSENVTSAERAALAAKRHGKHHPADTGLIHGDIHKKQLHDCETSETLPEGTKMAGIEL